VDHQLFDGCTSWAARCLTDAYSDAGEVEVEFDPRFSDPTRITIDEWRDGVDDEVEWIAQRQVLR
jgi:hypothetical protein